MTLPYLTHEVAPIPGLFRASEEDFIVDEIPAYAPGGKGNHLFVHFEKRNLTTKEAVKRIARALNVSERDAGWAGLKDRHALTTQWASFYGASAEAAVKLELENIRVLQAAPHSKKLRTGHLKGNRFKLWVRQVPCERMDDVQRILDAITKTGLPNFYGEQRFGKSGDNFERALRFIRGQERPPPSRFERKLLVSAFQAELFNRHLSARMQDGLFNRALKGDLMRKEETGGLFIAEDIATEQARMDAWQISPTGPMFGAEMRVAEGNAGQREAQTLGQAEISLEDLVGFRKWGAGTRRAMRVKPQALELYREEDAFCVTFTLPKGSYATTLLREILKSPDGPPEGLS